MRRLGSSVVTTVVGVSVLTLYLGAAWFLSWLIWTLVFETVDPVTIAVTLALTTVVVGYLSYRFSTAQALMGLDATELTPERLPGLYRRLDRLCSRMDVARPQVYVATMDAPNAFTLGGGRRGLIVVDRSLFRLLEADEFEALLAHELAHLASYDSLLKTLAFSAMQTVSGVVFLAVLPLVVAGTGVARATAWLDGRPYDSRARIERFRRVVARAVAVVLFVLTVALFAHSRRREYVADARAARATGNPLALARALEKIELVGNRRWLLSPLYVRGQEENPLTRLLSTHPPTDERVERLRRRTTRR